MYDHIRTSPELKSIHTAPEMFADLMNFVYPLYYIDANWEF